MKNYLFLYKFKSKWEYRYYWESFYCLQLFTHLSLFVSFLFLNSISFVQFQLNRQSISNMESDKKDENELLFEKSWTYYTNVKRNQILTFDLNILLGNYSSSKYSIQMPNCTIAFKIAIHHFLLCARYVLEIKIWRSFVSHSININRLHFRFNEIYNKFQLLFLQKIEGKNQIFIQIERF